MKRLLAFMFGSALLLCVFVTPAGAGSWAVTTLDEVGTPQATEVTLVEFTIRQHGVRPVNVDGTVGIEITSPSSEMRYFPAVPNGATGQYVAGVVFPEPGDFSWVLLQGPFGEQDLGTVSVGPAGVASDVVSSQRWPAVARFGLPVLAAALTAIAAGGAVQGWRRRAAA